MTDRHVDFRAHQVRAALDGRLSQTRRVLKPKWRDGANQSFSRWSPERVGPNDWILKCTNIGASIHVPYAPGDRLWVREAFTLNPAVRHLYRAKNAIYRADVPDAEPPVGPALTGDRITWAYAQGLKWKPSIHMPRWASRLTLTVTDVRVQKLHEIEWSDAAAEGVDVYCEKFSDLWNSIHGPAAWDANPWVCALTFTVEKRNIDTSETKQTGGRNG